MNKMFVILLSINICGLIFLGYFIKVRGGQDYLKIKFKQIFQKESCLDSFERLRRCRIDLFFNLPFSNSDILMVGDSITESGHWSELLNNENFKNRGIGGETTTGLKEWFPKLVGKEPYAVVLLIGINNLKSGDQKTFDKYLYEMRELCDSIPVVTKCYLMGILPINEKISADFMHCTNYDLAKVNAELKKIADCFVNIEYIEAKSFMEDTSFQLSPEFTYDGVHLTYKGYSQYVNLVLEPLFNK